MGRDYVTIKIDVERNASGDAVAKRLRGERRGGLCEADPTDQGASTQVHGASTHMPEVGPWAAPPARYMPKRSARTATHMTVRNRQYW